MENNDLSIIEFTDEQLLQDITLDRVNNWMIDHGEDFLDYCEDLNTEKLAYEFMGFALARHPEWAKELIDSCNGRNIYTQKVQEIYYDDEGNRLEELFYQDLCDFINYTIHTKRKVNKFLLDDE